MNLTLGIWRQNGPEDKDAIHRYQVKGISEKFSFLEMLDVLNKELFARGEEPVTFDSNCREGICGQYGVVISDIVHGPEVTTTCQLHMRSFNGNGVITVEPQRTSGFPIIRDLVVNRNALDRIIQAGGYISVNTGAPPGAHTTPIPKQDADRAFGAAAYIGCDTCVAACPSASAMLFTLVKVTHLGLLPQDKLENYKRVVSMLSQMGEEGFSSCSDIDGCAEVCPKQTPLDTTANLNHRLGKAAFKGV